MQARLVVALLVVLVSNGFNMGSYQTQARIGDVAEGQVVQEGNGALVLNVAPCGQAQLLQFHSPYRRRDLGQSSCPGGNTYTKSSIEQQ